MSVLYLHDGERCSWHKHETKFNLFFVVDGEIDIKTEWGNAKVESGQTFTTRPGEWHEFRTPNGPATVIEVMYVQYDPNDIQRELIGGKISVDESEERIGELED